MKRKPSLPNETSPQEVADPGDRTKIQAFLDRLADDPALRAEFGIRDDVEIGSEPAIPADDPLADLILARTHELSHALVWGIKLDGAGGPTRLDDAPVTGRVYGHDNDLHNRRGIEFSCQLAKVPALETAGGEYELTFTGLPADVTPLNLTLGDAGLTKGEALLEAHTDALRPAWGKRRAEWECRPQAQVELQKSAVGGPLAEPYYEMACDAAPPGTARRFLLDAASGRSTVDLKCEPSTRRDYQLAVLETQFLNAAGDAVTYVARRALVLERHPDARPGAAFIKSGVDMADVLPDVPSIDRVRLKLRPAATEDLRWLTTDDVTDLLGQVPYNPFPLRKTERGYRLRVLDSDRADLANPNLTWMLTVALSNSSNS